MSDTYILSTSSIRAMFSSNSDLLNRVTGMWRCPGCLHVRVQREQASRPHIPHMIVLKNKAVAHMSMIALSTSKSQGRHSLTTGFSVVQIEMTHKSECIVVCQFLFQGLLETPSNHPLETCIRSNHTLLGGDDRTCTSQAFPSSTGGQFNVEGSGSCALSASGSEGECLKEVTS